MGYLVYLCFAVSLTYNPSYVYIIIMLTLLGVLYDIVIIVDVFSFNICSG